MALLGRSLLGAKFHASAGESIAHAFDAGADAFANVLANGCALLTADGTANSAADAATNAARVVRCQIGRLSGEVASDFAKHLADGFALLPTDGGADHAADFFADAATDIEAAGCFRSFWFCSSLLAVPADDRAAFFFAHFGRSLGGLTWLALLGTFGSFVALAEEFLNACADCLTDHLAFLGAASTGENALHAGFELFLGGELFFDFCSSAVDDVATRDGRCGDFSYLGCDTAGFLSHTCDLGSGISSCGSSHLAGLGRCPCGLGRSSGLLLLRGRTRLGGLGGDPGLCSRLLGLLRCRSLGLTMSAHGRAVFFLGVFRHDELRGMNLNFEFAAGCSRFGAEDRAECVTYRGNDFPHGGSSHIEGFFARLDRNFADDLSADRADLAANHAANRSAYCGAHGRSGGATDHIADSGRNRADHGADRSRGCPTCRTTDGTANRAACHAADGGCGTAGKVGNTRLR